VFSATLREVVFQTTVPRSSFPGNINDLKKSDNINRLFHFFSNIRSEQKSIELDSKIDDSVDSKKFKN